MKQFIHIAGDISFLSRILLQKIVRVGGGAAWLDQILPGTILAPSFLDRFRSDIWSTDIFFIKISYVLVVFGRGFNSLPEAFLLFQCLLLVRLIHDRSQRSAYIASCIVIAFFETIDRSCFLRWLLLTNHTWMLFRLLFLRGGCSSASRCRRCDILGKVEHLFEAGRTVENCRRVDRCLMGLYRTMALHWGLHYVVPFFKLVVVERGSTADYLVLRGASALPAEHFFAILGG